MSEDAAFWWSLVLSSSTLGVFWLAGSTSARVRAAAWWVTIATEPLWAVFGWLTGGLLFVVQAVAFVVVAVVNLRRLHRSRDQEPDQACVPG